MNDDSLNAFERLASLAKDEPPSPIDVADRVLETLCSNSAPISRGSPEEYWVGIGSALAACAASVAFWFVSGDEPLLLLAEPFFTVSQ